MPGLPIRDSGGEIVGTKIGRVREALAGFDGKPVSIKALARLTGIKPTSVHRTLDELRDAGEIETTRAICANGRMATNIYRLVKPAGQAAE